MSDIIKLCSFSIPATFLKKIGETFAQIRRLVFPGCRGNNYFYDSSRHMKQEVWTKEFKLVDTSSLVDKVEAQLVNLLQQQKLKVGDSIPKELELAQAIGVSRTVIREALLRLRIMGLIETKKKRGAVITKPDFLQILNKSMNPHILDQDTLKEIFELRLVLEIGMADLLFHRVTKKDIEELYAIIAKEPSTTRNHLFNIDHEIAFHGKLYEITGNNTLKQFQKMLLPIFDYVHHSGLLKKQTLLKTFVSHKELVQILEKGTPEDFRMGMRAHLENHFLRIFDKKSLRST